MRKEILIYLMAAVSLLLIVFFIILKLFGPFDPITILKISGVSMFIGTMAFGWQVVKQPVFNRDEFKTLTIKEKLVKVTPVASIIGGQLLMLGIIASVYISKFQ